MDIGIVGRGAIWGVVTSYREHKLKCYGGVMRYIEESWFYENMLRIGQNSAYHDKVCIR